MKRIIFILIIFLIYSCDYIECSSEQLSSFDVSVLKDLNHSYSQFEIYPDSCLPLGYYNAKTIDNSEIDTLLLYEIFDKAQNSNIKPKKMQVFDSENSFKFIIHKYQGKHMILTSGDL
jgi:hypothetical protein